MKVEALRVQAMSGFEAGPPRRQRDPRWYYLAFCVAAAALQGVEQLRGRQGGANCRNAIFLSK